MPIKYNCFFFSEAHSVEAEINKFFNKGSDCHYFKVYGPHGLCHSSLQIARK